MMVDRRPRFIYAARKVALPLFYLFLWDIFVTALYYYVTPDVQQIELPLTLFGTALALFIGFCVNAAYARWWEARGLWGLMINASRNVARQAISFCDESVPGAIKGLAREIARGQIAYVHVLRTSLRGQPMPDEARRYLPADQVEGLARIANKHNMILTDMALMAARALKAGMLDPYARVRIEATLVDIANAQGGMERIKNTPLPSQYRFFPLIFAHVFCIILPFAVVQKLGIYTPFGSAFVGLMFLMAVQIGLDLMDPFADDIYDVPMTAMCRTIEIDLLQMLGEPAPEPVRPVDGILW
ncbi:putative membrane protein [Beijerinckiaceae bacterium RH CH11]|nr:bestrophin family ion channel [Beijerinckiaceae bacterium]VVB47571.1 putative membrane protein [Beijerinckiaceae bacterium RH CH11]VVB47652.1 putative membrane protein [Beijerinckiaceae bacterium RH AL8]